MSLDLFNNLLDNAKENSFVQNFIKEISKYLENKVNENQIEEGDSGLKEENTLYQVVDVKSDGAYLQNVNNNKVYEEKDISEDVLSKIESDTILRYKDGEYVIDEDMTEQFFNSMVDIKEYKKIQENFANDTNISEIDSDTKFTIQEHGDDYTILSYDNGTIQVPNELIPFFANENTVLYYKNGKFNREV